MKSEVNAGGVIAYVTGFIISLLLTLVAYYLVASKSVAGSTLVGLLLVLAVTQLMVQLYFFLHLGREEKPKWNLQMGLFAAMVVVILVIGSLWIMSNLEYNMHSPSEIDKEMIKDEGIKK